MWLNNDCSIASPMTSCMYVSTNITDLYIERKDGWSPPHLYPTPLCHKYWPKFAQKYCYSTVADQTL